MAKGQGAGRPTKKTPELVAKLTRALATGAPLALAAQAAGIDRDTLLEWRKDPAFAAQISQCLAVAQLANLAVVASGAPGWQGAAWILERRHPKRWGKRETVTVDHRNADRMTRDEVIAELERLQATIAEAVRQ
jgi:3-mercaptopyruvate sulfurtransferase SseA